MPSAFFLAFSVLSTILLCQIWTPDPTVIFASLLFTVVLWRMWGAPSGQTNSTNLNNLYGQSGVPAAAKELPASQYKGSIPEKQPIQEKQIGPVKRSVPEKATVPERQKSLEKKSVSFHYEPLDRSIDSIRLILLQPGKQGDALLCKLVHVTFASRPKYEALSYTWGELHNRKQILVNGMKMDIGKNLYDALHTLRSDTAVRTLWADAICINQNDLEERNHQVGLMVFTYTRAQGVYVWLGDFDIKESPWTDIPWTPEFEVKLVSGLTGVTYWKRLWIIQEIGLAYKINVFFRLCGKPWFLDWESDSKWQRTLVFLLEHRPHFPSQAPRKLVKLRQERHGDGSRLEQLMENFKDAECSEPRDGVFGFLGLANDCQGGNLRVDYSKPLIEIYEELIRFQYKLQPLKGPLPSAIDRSMRLVRFSQTLQNLLQGSIGEEVRKRMPRSLSSEFSLRAVIRGKILYMGPSYIDISSSFEMTKRWKTSLERYYSTAEDLKSLRATDEAYTKVLLDMPEAEVSKFCNIASQSSTGAKAAGSWMTKPPIAGNDIADMSCFGPESCEIETSSGPRRFLGSHLLMGLAPPGTKRGDLVCGFWGCDTIAVMRSNGMGGYRIIGKANIAPIGLIETKPKPVEEQEDFDYDGVMNIEIDIDTLQKLTC